MDIDRYRIGPRSPSPRPRARRRSSSEAVSFGPPILVVSRQTSVPQAPRSNGWRCRVIKAATAKEGFFAITVNDVDTIGVIVSVELERGAAESQLSARTGAEVYGR